MRTNDGADLNAMVLGATAGDSGTSTAVAATTLTDSGKSWTVNAWKGKVVATGLVYGVVVSNTGTVLTVDRWYTPASPSGAAASTPATGSYVICAGGQPAFWLALTTDATAPSATDTTLASELTGFGLQRTVATYAHTTGAASYTLTKTFTSTDPTARTINKLGVFNAAAGGMLLFTSAMPSPPTLVSGDTLTVTETANL